MSANKSSVSSTKANIIYNMAYQILIMLLPFITAPYISRVFGTDGIGKYTYTYSIANYFVLFSMMGLTNYGNRSIARTRDDKCLLNKTFSEIYTMQLGFSAIALIIYWCMIPFFDEGYRALLMIQSLYIVSAIFDISWFYYGIEKFKMMVMRNGIIKIITTISTFIFVRNLEDIWKYAFIICLGFVGSNLYLFILVHRYAKFEIPNVKNVLRHVKPNLILFIPDRKSVV